MHNQNNLNNTINAYNTHDSWALWEVPTESLSQKSDQERQVLFGACYKENVFPIDALSDFKLSDVKYVLVGLNPGNEGVHTENGHQFLNFHGKKKSMDYRLAAALYGTELWGAFMTDLVHVNESDSNKVAASKEDVLRLEKHLDELQIPESAVLVGIGAATSSYLEKYAQRRVEKIPHYSGANGHWNATKTRQAIQKIVDTTL